MEVMDRKSLSPLATSPAAGSAVPKAPVAGAPLGADRLRVSLIIPARNEARNIAWVLEQIPDSVTEVILVDGASTDVTLITARSYRPDIKVVAQDGVGKGSALRTGFLAATGDVIVMMDADGSMAPRRSATSCTSSPTATTSSRALDSSPGVGRWTSPLCADWGTGSCWACSTCSTGRN